MSNDHPEIMLHRESFDFMPGNCNLSAVEVGLVNVMSRKTVLRQYVDSVKQDYNYILLDCPLPQYSRMHDFYHSYAVVLIMRNDDIRTLQENFGRATAAFTLDCCCPKHSENS